MKFPYVFSNLPCEKHFHSSMQIAALPEKQLQFSFIKKNKMKKTLFVVVAILFSMCLFISCSRHRRHRHNISVSVTESHDIYKLQAEYNEDKTGAVQRYINRQIAPNGLFASTEDYFDVDTELKDKTKFYIKASPGELIIKLNKQENSYASYTRIKSICEGVTSIIKEK